MREVPRIALENNRINRNRVKLVKQRLGDDLLSETRSCVTVVCVCVHELMFRMDLDLVDFFRQSKQNREPTRILS